MPKLTYAPKDGPEVYLGEDDGKPIYANEGDTIEVSEDKADQLLRDFPAWFKKAR